jgi:hypothetical protein
MSVIAPTLSAQEEDGFDRTQIITGDRTLTVDKAFKITESPTAVDIPGRSVDTTYSLIPKRPSVTLGTEPIEPARIKVREPLDPIYLGYIQGGAGTYQSPFLEAMYTSTRKRDFSYGIKYRHLSANRGIRDVAFSGFSENEIAAWGKKIFRKHTLESKAAFSRDVFHYYGFDPQDAEISKRDIRQRFELFSLDNKWKSYYRDSSKVNHDLDLNIYNLSDRLGASEFGVFAGGELHTYRGDQFYTLRTGFGLISYRSDGVSPFNYMDNQVEFEDTDASVDNAILHAVPQILLRTGGLSATVGLGIYLQVQNTGRFHAFPDAEVSYSLFNDILIPYAGITGSVNRVGYRTLSRSNPWVMNSLNLENSVTKYNIFGGIRGSVTDNLSFNTRVSLVQTDNMPLFVNDIIFSTENRFNVIYDDIGTFSMLGELTYANSEKWEAFTSVEILSYSTDAEAEAWHLPSHRIAIGGKYNLFDKFSAGMTLTWIGARQVKSFLPVPPDFEALPEGDFAAIELDPYLDLSLQAEYRYTSRISAFIDVHNVAAARYNIYYRFPAQRAFVMGGARYLF